MAHRLGPFASLLLLVVSASNMARSADSTLSNVGGGDGVSKNPDADGGFDWSNWANDVTSDIWGDSVGPFGQCGGAGYDSNQTCILDWKCVQLANTFSECLPADWTPIAATPTSSPAPLDPSPTPTTQATDRPSAQLDKVPAWQQCGGRNFNYNQYASGTFRDGDATKLRCSDGYQCNVMNEWFFQCLPIHDPDSAVLWSQCGGESYKGKTNCIAGSYCKFANQWYSQCVPTQGR